MDMVLMGLGIIYCGYILLWLFSVMLLSIDNYQSALRWNWILFSIPAIPIMVLGIILLCCMFPFVWLWDKLDKPLFKEE